MLATCPGRAISVFTRVFDALWRDQGSRAADRELVTFWHWVPGLAALARDTKGETPSSRVACSAEICNGGAHNNTAPRANDRMPQDNSHTIETPVLIVGGGPVGLALAADLGWRGAPCLVIEQGEGPADHPRATAINARSMEFMRRWGVADAVRAASAPSDFPHTALYCTTLSGFEIARIDRPHHGGRGATTTSPERAQRCNQIWLDPILRDLAASFQSVDLRYRWRFEQLTQENDHV